MNSLRKAFPDHKFIGEFLHALSSILPQSEAMQARATLPCFQQATLSPCAGEENSAALGGSPDLTDDPTWMCDPLDGTTNFVHSFPFVCVSIGLAVKKRVVVGVVYNPVMDELFTAAQVRAHLAC